VVCKGLGCTTFSRTINLPWSEVQPGAALEITERISYQCTNRVKPNSSAGLRANMRHVVLRLFCESYMQSLYSSIRTGGIPTHPYCPELQLTPRGTRNTAPEYSCGRLHLFLPLTLDDKKKKMKTKTEDKKMERSKTTITSVDPDEGVSCLHYPQRDKTRTRLYLIKPHLEGACAGI
jgi:hypothetical protein